MATRSSRHRVQLVVALAALTGCTPQTPAVTPQPSEPVPAQLFELRASIWVNLHQRLYAETGPRPAEPQHGAEAFTPVERETWDAALAFYRRWIPERTFLTPLSEPLAGLNQRLSRQPNATDLSAAGLDPELTNQLELAAAVYRRHGWSDDEHANRAWIQRLEPRLRRHGRAFADTLVSTYGVPWPDRPIRVEVAVHAGPVGAYTVDEPPLITMTSALPTYQDEAAFEMVFHEASHVLVHDVELAIARAFEARGEPVADRLWHALLFYTAGEIARRYMPGYIPYAYRNGLYGPRQHWDVYEQALRAHWQPFLDGRITREAALRELVAATAVSSGQ